MSNEKTRFEMLMETIDVRRHASPEDSYTAALMAGGMDGIADKIIEEAGELVQAARATETDADSAHLVHEVADLVYHVFVLMRFKGVSLEQLETELAARSGTSGFAEKANRPGDA